MSGRSRWSGHVDGDDEDVDDDDDVDDEDKGGTP